MSVGDSRPHCHRRQNPFAITSRLILLCWIFPASSSSQLPPPPITLLTTTLPPPASGSLVWTSTSGPSTPTSTGVTQESADEHAFNYYYFLIVAVLAVLLALVVGWFGRRRRRKAAWLRRQSQSALATDVEGFRRLRIRFVGGRGFTGGDDEGHVEGLNERGEAPPPYTPGGKPPSLRNLDLHEGSEVQQNGMAGDWVDLRRLEHGSYPPEYHEDANRSTVGELGTITRPAAAVLAVESLRSISWSLVFTEI